MKAILLLFLPRIFDNRNNVHKNIESSIRSAQPDIDDLVQSVNFLAKYNEEFIKDLSEAKSLGLSPSQMTFRRAQKKGLSNVKNENERLRKSICKVRESSRQLVFGIMAESGEIGIQVLKSWIAALNVEKGLIFPLDENGIETKLENLLLIPVYIKYNSSDSGNAYLKPYLGPNRGVIFQPILNQDNESSFRQYGDFPLGLFTTA